jgi:hypothetical protein
VFSPLRFGDAGAWLSRAQATMIDSELTLRSRSVEGIYEESWGALIACNLNRREMASAAFEARCAPTELCFVRSFHLIQHEVMPHAHALAKLPAVLKRLRDHLKLLINAKRPSRPYDRAIRSRPARYTVDIKRHYRLTRHYSRAPPSGGVPVCTLGQRFLIVNPQSV